MKAACWLMERFGVPNALIGDLAERGRSGRSHLWLWRQALVAIGITMRMRGGAMLGWALVFFTAATARTLFDTFAPPVNYGPRSAVTTYVAIGIVLVAGCHASFRTGHIRSGAWLTVMSFLIGHAMAGLFTSALFVSVIASDPAKLREFQVTGGFGEVFWLPIMLLPIVAVVGTLGGTVGSVASRRRPSA